MISLKFENQLKMIKEDLYAQINGRFVKKADRIPDIYVYESEESTEIRQFIDLLSETVDQSKLISQSTEEKVDNEDKRYLY